jgi:hypothetical protein
MPVKQEVWVLIACLACIPWSQMYWGTKSCTEADTLAFVCKVPTTGSTSTTSTINTTEALPSVTPGYVWTQLTSTATNPALIVSASSTYMPPGLPANDPSVVLVGFASR